MVKKLTTTERFSPSGLNIRATVRPSEGNATVRLGLVGLHLTREDIGLLIDALEEIEEALEP